MRNGLLVIVLLTGLALATGCTQSKGSLFGGQETIESASQWNVLANDVANRINNELMRQHYLTASVFVRHSCGTPEKCGEGGTFPFDEGFNDLLTTQLVNFGVHTMVAPEHANLVVDYKVQTLYHPSDWRSWHWPKPGVLTALAAGISVIRDAPWEIIPVAAAVDMFRANYRHDGQYEVIITVSIVDKNRYVTRFSDVYFINNGDFWQYRPTAPAPEIQLTGPSGPAAPATTRKTSL